MSAHHSQTTWGDQEAQPVTTLTLVDRSPYAMTTRARVYLATAGLRHFLIGLMLLFVPWLFHSAVYVPIFSLLPLHLWAVLMTTVGASCLAAAAWRNAALARLGMGASAVLTLALAAGLLIGVVATWVEWVDRVGWPLVQQLLVDHPAQYPAALLAYGPAPLTPFLPLIMLAITVKDFTMCAQPLRVPLEESVGDVRLTRS